jgi:hypothetical protein
MTEFEKDKITEKGKTYGTECKNCGHRIGVHFVNLETKGESCNGYGEGKCNCKKYVKPSGENS